MANMLWFGVHAAYLLSQIALLAASAADFNNTGNNDYNQIFADGESGNISPLAMPTIPSAGIGVSVVAIVFNAIIIFLVYRFQKPSTSSTEESRQSRRRYVLMVGALFAVCFAVADFVFAGLFPNGANGQAPPLAACALSAIAGVIAVAAFVVDLYKISKDRKDSKDVVEMEQYQYQGA